MYPDRRAESGFKQAVLEILWIRSFFCEFYQNFCTDGPNYNNLYPNKFNSPYFRNIFFFSEMLQSDVKGDEILVSYRGGTSRSRARTWPECSCCEKVQCDAIRWVQLFSEMLSWSSITLNLSLYKSKRICNLRQHIENN